jgi:hypothetical protein
MPEWSKGTVLKTVSCVERLEGSGNRADERNDKACFDISEGAMITLAAECNEADSIPLSDLKMFVALFLRFFYNTNTGEMPEWSKGTVLKTVSCVERLEGSGDQMSKRNKNLFLFPSECR